MVSGHDVCREAWVHMMGIGKQRLLRCRHTFQGRDARSLPGGALSPALFLLKVWRKEEQPPRL